MKKALALVLALLVMIPFFAVAETTDAGYTFGLATLTTGRVGPGKDAAENQVYSVNTVLGFVVFDKDGKVAFSQIDVLETLSGNAGEDHGPLFTGWPGQPGNTADVAAATEESFLAEVTKYITKRDKGDSYQMKSGTWAQEMDGFQRLFVGKTVEEIEEWFEKYTSSKGRPLTDGLEDADKAKYDALTDEEKTMLADVTSSATMSLKDSHGDMLGIYRKAWENRLPFTLGN